MSHINLIKLITEPSAKQIFEDIETERSVYGDELGDALVHDFIQYFTGLVVYNAINSKPSHMNNEQLFEHISNRLAEQKSLFSSAISIGFSEAAKQFYNKPFEYECIIQPVYGDKKEKVH